MKLLSLFLCAGALTAQAAVQNDILYGWAGGEELRLDVSVPDGPGPFPAVILVHGGGWTSGDKSGGPLKTFMVPMQAPLAAAGYAYFSINYRLAPKHPHPAALEDVQTAIRWVKAHAAHYHLDPHRIALAGDSSGAQLAALAAVQADDATRVAAVVCFYGPFDLVTNIVQRGIFSTNLQALIGRQTLDDETRRQLAAVSPFNFVKPGLPPFLLVHGTNDATVAFAQSTAMLARLQAAQVKSQLIPIKGGRHGMLAWDQFRPTFKAEVISWLNATLTLHKPATIGVH